MPKTGGKNKKIVQKSKAKNRSNKVTILTKLKPYRWWIVISGLLILEVAAQVLYPHRYTLPLARYNHEFYGFKHRNVLNIKEQDAFNNATVKFNSSSGSEQVKLTTLGATLNETDTFNTLSEYHMMWRFVPFSILWQQPQVNNLPVSFAHQSLEVFIEEFAKKHHVDAKNATVAIDNGRVTATEAIPGSDVDKTSLKDRIISKKYDIYGFTTVDVPENNVAPNATADDLAAVREQAELAVAREIYISIAGRDEIFTPSREQLAGWLQLADIDGEIKLQLNPVAVASYVDEINQKVARPAGETTVVVVDGQEAERHEASPGERIEAERFTEQVNDVIFTSGRYKYIRAELVRVAPKVKHVYSYTNSQAGLVAKLHELGRRYNVRISLKQLNGAGWQASYRGNESTPSASTYKLYIALRLFEDINTGHTAWNAPMLDTTVAGCFDRMILHSTNQCAETWINQFGRGHLNQFLQVRGISEATTFTSYDATRTSANDLLRVVEGVYNGQLASGHNREKLLDMMSRQIWRQGIPAGTQGWTSNKVGFLWDYVHDVGVVHHPRGTYIVAIMTKGANYGIIAQITRELEAFMYP